METGIRLEILWLDADLLEIRVDASNGRFAGTVDRYCGPDIISRLAETVRGFPTSIEDRREWEIGSVDSASDEWGVKLVLHCANRSGYVIADIMLKAESQNRGLQETVSFSILVAPAAIDNFVTALVGMPMVVGAVVKLRSISS